ncbi:MAG TPA: sulfite exporter TauE/SafE family protein, partial [Actinomycetota bacterium]|nr:sulfite exporter TauE/SafE family protein [Actinomycetota bacterium]
EPGLLRDALTLLLGFATGVLSALFGIGGAIVSNPGLRALGAEPLVAVGTTLPSILPGAITGTLRYRREGLIDWRLIAPAAAAGLLTVVAGSLLSHAVPGGGHLLLLLIAVLLAFTAWRTAVTPPSDPAGDEDDGGSSGGAGGGPHGEVEGGSHRAERGSHGEVEGGAEGVDNRGHPDAGSAPLPLRGASPREGGLPRATGSAGTGGSDPPGARESEGSPGTGGSNTPGAGQRPGRPGRPRWVAAGSGVVAGLLSGLLGIGGGVIMVPAFTELLGLPLKSAIATSLVCVGIFGVPATITHAVLGDIDWRLATLLTVGVIPGARIGASLTIRTAERRLRLAVGVFLALVSLVYFVTETRALLEEL